MDDLVRRYGELLLLVVGLMLLALAAVTDRNVVLIAAGSGLMLVGVFAGRMEGPLKLGPTGLETVLRGRAAEEAAARELVDSGTDEALDAERPATTAVGRRRPG